MLHVSAAASAALLLAEGAGAAFLGGARPAGPAPARANGVAMQAVSEFGLDVGQKYGPTNPAHPAKLPWTNLEKQEGVQLVKAASNGLRAPLDADMKDDEIFVSKDAIHILKHHGSYMQQNRMVKGKEKALTYQFMLRLKVPVGEVPAHVYRELDDLSNKYGQGDLRATTRQAFQLHGVVKSHLAEVVSSIANVGSNTYGGCGDINRNIMAPPVTLYNNPAYEYCMQYSRAIAELFKPSTTAFTELWLNGEKAKMEEYYTRDVKEFNLDEVRAHDSGNGIITGHPVEPLYGRTYLPKKFKIAFTVPGDNSLDIYINDIGCVVIMEEDGKTLKGFNIMVGGGLGRTHKKETTFARAASHLGFVKKEDFFEAMKAILAVQRDHGNREVRASARLKYLVHALGIDEFRSLTEKYYGKKIEPWAELPPWKLVDWMGWHEQGDGKWMLGVNVEQGRVRDTPTVALKTVLRLLVDTFNLPMTLTPHQSIVLRDILPEHKESVVTLLELHGVKMIDDVDRITRNSIACPAFPLCGLAMAEAERVQPEINARFVALLDKMGLEDTKFITRTTGCPNGCARPYMAEIALVGSGPKMYQLWLGGSPRLDRLATATDIFKMKFDDLEKTCEPIFAMYKSERSAGEGFGDWADRTGWEAIKEFSATYTPGDWEKMTPKVAPAATVDEWEAMRPAAPPVGQDGPLPPPTGGSVDLDPALLAQLGPLAASRGVDTSTLIGEILKEKFSA